MRILFSSILICASSFIYSQTVYDWANRQYNPDEMAEHAKDEFLYLNGAVSRVIVTIDFLNPDKSIGNRTEFYTYTPSGKIKKVEVIEPDGSGFIQRYFYTDKDSIAYDLTTYFLEESGLIDTVREDSNFIYEPINLHDSIRTDSRGNVIYFKANSNEVYTRFDAAGRKVLDSIPATNDMEAHMISYTYRRNKVKKTVFYLDQDYSSTTIYWVDDQKNWVKAKLMHTKRHWNVMIRREIIYANN